MACPTGDGGALKTIKPEQLRCLPRRLIPPECPTGKVAHPTALLLRRNHLSQGASDVHGVRSRGLESRVLRGANPGPAVLAKQNG